MDQDLDHNQKFSSAPAVASPIQYACPNVARPSARRAVNLLVVGSNLTEGSTLDLLSYQTAHFWKVALRDPKKPYRASAEKHFGDSTASNLRNQALFAKI